VQAVLESPRSSRRCQISLEAYSPVGSADPDPVESYPFREYDLTLLRKVMQELITQGRATERDYIQGRALLVLVRSLFTKFGWSRCGGGALVTWDELFDLLVEETTYVPLWVQEMLDNTLIPTFDGDEDAWEVCVSKALYLLNQTPAVPATPDNLGRLMLDDVNASVDQRVEETQSALNTLVDKRKVLTETNDQGTRCTRWFRRARGVLSRAQTKAERISRTSSLPGWRRDSGRATISSGATAVSTRPVSATSDSFASLRVLDSRPGGQSTDHGVRCRPNSRPRR